MLEREAEEHSFGFNERKEINEKSGTIKFSDEALQQIELENKCQEEKVK